MSEIRKRVLPKSLVAGVVGSAVIGSMPAAAQAGETSVKPDGMPKQLTFGVEGAVTFADFTQDKLGGGPDDGIDGDIGYFGALSVSRGISKEWDWRLSASHTGFSDNTLSIDEDPYYVSFAGAFRASMIDFDIGKSWETGRTTTRLGVGLSGGNINQAMDKGFVENTYPSFINFDGDLGFAGIGPRLSADISHRIGNDSSGFRVIAGASISPMYGKFTSDKGISGYDGDADVPIGPVSFKESDNGGVVASSAYLGLAYDASADTTFKFGLRANRYDDFGTDELGFINGAVSTRSAFVGMDVKF